VESSAEDFLRSYLAGRGAGKQLEELVASLGRADQELVQKLVETLRPSANALGELVSVAEELRRREKKGSIGELFDEFGLFPLLETGGRKRQYRELMKRLGEARSPLHSRLQAEIEGCVKEIAASHGLKLTVPAELEGDTVELRLKLRRAGDLESFSERLKQLAGDSRVERIFQILQGKW
jgi:hypothetical protein